MSTEYEQIIRGYVKAVVTGDLANSEIRYKNPDALADHAIKVALALHEAESRTFSSIRHSLPSPMKNGKQLHTTHQSYRDRIHRNGNGEKQI